MKSESEVTQPCPTLCDPLDCSLRGSSVHGILQARATLVNGRVIKNNDLNRCIIDSYHTYIHKGRYPIIVLNIDVDPILVDINIHPTKMDIKFSKLDSLLKLISNSIDDRLKTLTLIPEANVRTSTSFNEVYNQIKHVDDEEEKVLKKEEKNYEEIKLDFEVHEDKEEIVDSIEEKEEKVARINKMNVIGNVFMTYILCYNEDGFYLVDQHAAAERINYEKYMNEFLNGGSTVIDLLTPIKIELSKDNYLRIKDRLYILDELGISCEEFGEGIFLVRSHPQWIDQNNSSKEINNIFELISQKGEFSKEKFIDTTIMSIACHNSVKAHEYLSNEDMQWIVDNVRYCDNPFTCPHGRPTIITYTRDELDKMFKRDYNE